MTPVLRLPCKGRRPSGQATLEYLVVGLVLASVFFLPWDGTPGGVTVVELMLGAIRTGFDRYLSALSLPV